MGYPLGRRHKSNLVPTVSVAVAGTHTSVAIALYLRAAAFGARMLSRLLSTFYEAHPDLDRLIIDQ